MGIEQTRRANLRKLVADSGGPTLLAQRLGYRNPSFIVQMTGPSPIREVSEKTARRIEASLGLPPLTLDREEQPRRRCDTGSGQHTGVGEHQPATVAVRRPRGTGLPGRHRAQQSDQSRPHQGTGPTAQVASAVKFAVKHATTFLVAHSDGVEPFAAFAIAVLIFATSAAEEKSSVAVASKVAVAPYVGVGALVTIHQKFRPFVLAYFAGCIAPNLSHTDYPAPVFNRVRRQYFGFFPFFPFFSIHIHSNPSPGDRRIGTGKLASLSQ